MPVFPSSYTSRTVSLVIRIAALCCKMLSSHSRGWVKEGGDGVVVPAAVAFLKQPQSWRLLGMFPGFSLAHWAMYTLTCSLFFIIIIFIFIFLRPSFTVALEPVLELALVEQSGLELTKIYPPLPAECWD